MKNVKRIGLAAVMLLVSLSVVPATGTEEAAVGDEVVTLTYFSADLGRIVRENNPVVAEIEARTNTKLEFTLVPAADLSTKYNLLVASGDVPDITRLNQFDYLQYVDQGIYYDLSSMLNESNTPNLVKHVTPDQWDLMTYKGGIYGVPSIVWAGGRVYVLRKDWLGALGMDAPTNLVELKEVLRAFTQDDPDGNGKDDTYGLASDNAVGNNFASPFSMILGAFGMQPRLYYERDGKVYSGSIAEEYRQSLEYIHDLYARGYIDPEIFIMKRDQAREKLVQGVSGSLCAWWSIPEQILMDQLQMRAVNPNAEWIIADPIVGPGGYSGMLGRSPIGATANIAADTKSPLRALQFLDFLSSDEGSRLAFLGFEGEHYRVDERENFLERTEAGNAGMDQKWLDVLAQCVQRTDIQMDVYRLNNPTYWPFIIAGRDSPLYVDLFAGITTPEAQQMGADLTRYELEWFVKFAEGSAPLSAWGDYVAGWNRVGGREIFEANLAVYNERTGRNLTAGN